MSADGGGKRLASLGLAALAAAAVLAGLALTGGPMEARRERRDAAREGDLMALARQVECLAQQDDGALPPQVAASEACPFTGRLADPFTGMAYRYEAIDDRSWRLCAAFETPPDPDTRWGPAIRDEAGCTTHHLPPPVELRGAPPPEIEPERIR